MQSKFKFCASHIPPVENLRLNVARSAGYKVASCVIFPLRCFLARTFLQEL
ncbi:phosphoserine phosphatase [Enterobacter sp. EA-1]|nr:phosphoserine phosphatase [Enterobacter sp. EA-1]